MENLQRLLTSQNIHIWKILLAIPNQWIYNRINAKRKELSQGWKDMLMYALTSQELTALKNRSVANGWAVMPNSGNRAYYRRNGNAIELKSYNTVVFSYDTVTGELKRHWDGYSKTTLKHVRMFTDMINGKSYRRNTTFGKANWEAMPVC